LWNGENELLKRIAEVMREQKKNRWMNELVRELRMEGITSMSEVTNEEIRQRVSEWDTRDWLKEMSERDSLRIYRKWREIIGE